MEQKNKTILLIVVAGILVLSAGAYWFNFAGVKKSAAPEAVVPQSAQSTTVKNDSTIPDQAQGEKGTFISGKVRSMNEKQIYIELTDGKGSAININANTPVRTEGEDAVGNLALVRAEATVDVEVDENNNAIEITIKK